MGAINRIKLLKKPGTIWKKPKLWFGVVNTKNFALRAALATLHVHCVNNIPLEGATNLASSDPTKCHLIWV
jgi:hypothetical protein